MLAFEKIKRRIKDFFRPRNKIEPAIAYDLWATTYDEQTGNPIIYLVDILFNEMIANTEFENKIIVDIGCGTGRHWKNILARNPSDLIGCDVSKEMLKKLNHKFPKAKTYLIYDDNLKDLKVESCDIIVCNLVIGYIKDLSKAFIEWNRVLRNNGEVIITDFHPDMLQKGAERSFPHNGQSLLIKNYFHPLAKVRNLSTKNNWKEITLIERKVDDTIKHFYQNPKSLKAFEESFDISIVYAFHFKKQVS